jgi:hypothetical protein
MVQATHRLCLSFETLSSLIIGGIPRAQELDGDLAFEPDPFGAIHRPHRPFGEELENAIPFLYRRSDQLISF